MRRIVCLLVCLVVGAAAASAEEAPAYKLNLKPADGLPNGKVATLQGTANPAGDRFFIESVGVLQPVVVTLVAKNKGDAIKLVIGKQRWDEDLRHATTGDNGMATIKLRTQGEVRITVSGEGDKPYNLIVWVGDEVKPDFTAVPAVTPMKDYKGAKAGKGGAGGGGGAGGNTAGIIIACVLGVLILVGVVWLKRRGAKQ